MRTRAAVRRDGRAVVRPHPVVKHWAVKCRLQLDILRSQYLYYPYVYIFQSAVDSSSRQTECFLPRIQLPQR